MKNDVKRKIGTRRHLRAMYVERDDALAAMPLRCGRIFIAETPSALRS
jgi:hypothetical protein